MRYELRIAAYDVLDQVNYTIRIGQSQQPEGSPWGWETIRAGHFPGLGEGDPEQWTRDCLVALLETL